MNLFSLTLHLRSLCFYTGLPPKERTQNSCSSPGILGTGWPAAAAPSPPAVGLGPSPQTKSLSSDLTAPALHQCKTIEISSCTRISAAAGPECPPQLHKLLLYLFWLFNRPPLADSWSTDSWLEPSLASSLRAPLKASSRGFLAEPRATREV